MHKLVPSRRCFKNCGWPRGRPAADGPVSSACGRLRVARDSLAVPESNIVNVGVIGVCAGRKTLWSGRLGLR